MSIGRNESCPCGSGKKYKKCCLNWETTWRHGIDISDCEVGVKTIMLGAYDFIVEHQFQGGCHMISAVLYMLLVEQGYKPVIKTGEVGIADFVFDHSWLEIDKKVFDITIMSTLQDDKKLPPVILSKSVSSGLACNYQYGMTANLDFNTQMVLAQSIGQYIKGGKEHHSYLILREIAQNAGFPIEDIDGFIDKYMDAYREHSIELQ
ncbi:SEC-C domain-containing protein [Fusibacter paucivorans]|uniref:SEC-C domain-containing protein n=1 Tax=Fusibacter paucivorans TaxID=76009 RepID=A0ABS5PUI3_9FIRM|nr:SEC-C metal-binding domain-containing protein [Fusibacter paucivorans]MBS7528823.1 SEC-C domain-containing protein [Fusibacter paucivorans]